MATDCHDDAGPTTIGVMSASSAVLQPLPDRLLPADPALRDIARRLYATVKDLPIISPHGHVDRSCCPTTSPSPTRPCHGTVSEARKRRAAAKQVADKVPNEELERAEPRREERIRQRVLLSRTASGTCGVAHAAFEVIDAAAVEEALRVTAP